MSMVQEKMYMDVDDVCAILGAGKISTKFLAEKIYGMTVED